MSPDLLFSFLLFFQVQIESIKESGFYKMLVEKYPEIAESVSDPNQMDPEIQELIELTGINFDDLSEISITVEALDGIKKASQEGRPPQVGTELEFFFDAKVKGKLDAANIFEFILAKIEEERSEKFRKDVEKTITKKDSLYSITIPSELLDEDEETVVEDLIFSISHDGDYSSFQLGLPDKKQLGKIRADENSSLNCLNVMAKDRQITLGVKVDPALWERPEFNSQQQNPLFAGLANSVKGIREFGLSISFRDRTLGFEICVNCKDTQSALGLWTVAQGGLGMAQLAMAQNGRQAPAILSRIKTQAVEKNVFVRVEVLPSDLEEFENQFRPFSASSESAKSKIKTIDQDPLVGKKTPQFVTKLLDGENFDISKYEGKVVVLDFWATWCAPCVRALPQLIEVTSGFDNSDVVLVAVNQGEGNKKISQFLKQKKIDSLQVALDINQEIGKKYFVKGIPKTVVIDKNGIIRFVHNGFSSTLKKKLEKEISELNR